jgi:putative restriction endonuclease
MARPSQNDILKKIHAINTWKRGAVRAPHKPLLVLLSLARIAHGKERLAPFTELEGPLRRLLEEFGPPRRSIHPEYPFWRLQKDGLWEVPERVTLARRSSNTDPRKSELIKHAVLGGFPKPVFDAFRRDEHLRDQVATAILNKHLPASLHDDLLNEIGLSVLVMPPRRNPDFRDGVIQAYEHRCAVCGYDAKLNQCDLALDAGHIQWHQAGGPSTIQNGVALCAIHHRALDRGAIGLNDDLTILVSGSLHGDVGVAELFLAFKGKQLRAPHSPSMLPSQQYLAWHRQQVFRTPARD